MQLMEISDYVIGLSLPSYSIFIIIHLIFQALIIGGAFGAIQILILDEVMPHC